MSNFNILDVFNFEENLINNVIWQYENAENLKGLITQKDAWYQENLNDFWQQIVDDFLNIQTATDWGLNLWGQILQVKRRINVDGVQTVLSKELYRRLVLGKLQMIRSNGTVPEINKYLNFIFKPHSGNTGTTSFVKDNLDMTILYVLNFTPSEEEKALIYSREFFPTPAGVEDKIYIFDSQNIFGFKGTGFQPFNQAPFWNGQFI